MIAGPKAVVDPEVVGPGMVEAEVVLGPEVAVGLESVVGLAVGGIEPGVAVVVVVGGQVVRQAQKLPITHLILRQKTSLDHQEELRVSLESGKKSITTGGVIIPQIKDVQVSCLAR